MLGIVLSIIVILGLPGGPTGDFNDVGGTDNSVTTTSQSVDTVHHKK